MRQLPTVIATALVLTLAACGDGAGADAPQDDGDASAGLPSEEPAAIPISDQDGNRVGEVRLTEDPNGMTVAVSVDGLSAGTHAVHLHETGLCEGDFSSAGGHWNPTGAEHGRDNPQGAHVGDLANMQVGDDGRGEATFLVERAGLEQGEFRAADDDGTALVIHAEADDYRTDPSGNAGARVACTVIAQPAA